MNKLSGICCLTIVFAYGVCAAEDPLHTTSTLSAPRGFLAATAVGDEILIAGGAHNAVYSAVVDIYDTTSNTWSTASLGEARGYIGATTVGHKALFAGGYYSGGGVSWSSARVDMYDGSTGQWSHDWLSRPASNLAATSMGDLAFFAGGDAVDIYDNSSGTWAQAPLSVPRSYISATAVGNKVLFAGGTTGPGVTSEAVDIYDAESGTWSTASLYTGRYHIAAFSVGNRAFFVGGQIDGQGAHTSNLIDIYNADTDTWSLRTMPLTRSGSQIALLGDEVWLARYFPDDSYIDIFDTVTEQWRSEQYWPGRSNLASASTGDVAVFAGGGYFPAYDRVDILTVPEPAMLGLLALASPALLRKRRHVV